MKDLFKEIKYYFWAVNRRKIIDKLQKKHADVFYGTVLDIGGRDRGDFKKPREKVEKWIFADIEKKYNPDMVIDVTDMNNISDSSIDVINANELFEHVREIHKGLKECERILKPGGKIVISMPFIKEIHADPYDFQRWSDAKWKNELKQFGFEIEKFYITGRFFCVFTNMIKLLIKKFPIFFRLPMQVLFYPILDLIGLIDNTSFVLGDNKLKNFHAGYFFIAKKIG